MPQIINAASVVRQGASSAGRVPADFIVADVSNEMVKVFAHLTPLVNLLFLEKMVKWRQTANVEGLWKFPEKEMVPNRDLVTASTAGGSATITITPAQPNLYKVNTSITFEETNESGIVTTAGATIVVTRDPSSAGAARNWTQPSDNSIIMIQGEAMTEADTTPESIYMEPYMRTNAVQLFEKSLKMTDMMIAATMHAGTYGGNWWDDENLDKVYEMKRDMELALWQNQNYWTTKTAGVWQGKTEGIGYQILNNNGAHLPYGSVLDKADWKEFMRMMKGGSAYSTVFVGDQVAGALEDILEEKVIWDKPIVRYGPIAGEDVIELFRWRTVNRIVDIIRHPLWEGTWEQKAIAIDRKYLYGCHYAPDKKGPRKFRIEMGVEPDGTPREDVKLLAQIGAGVGATPNCGVLEP